MITRELLNKIIKEYKEEENEYTPFMYKRVDREVLLSVTYAYQNKEITREEFLELSDMIMEDYIKKACETIIPYVHGNEKCTFKVSKMSPYDLRLEIEDAWSDMEDIENTSYDLALENQEKWIKIYKLQLMRIDLATRELIRRKFNLEDIKTC